MRFFLVKLPKTILYFWVFSILGLSIPARADDGDFTGQYYTVKVWGAVDGFMEGSVTDVAQTPEGYLWIGTVFGSVLRFDGTRFVSFNSANTPEFSLKWGLPRLMVDKAGTLWISIYDGGMTTWDRQGFHSTFTSTNEPDRLLWSAPGKVVFVYDNQKKLLSGNKHGEKWDWETVNLSGDVPQTPPCADADGHVWYRRSDHEIGVWDGREIKTLTNIAGLEGQQLGVLVADASGHIWAGTDRCVAEWQTDHFEVKTPTNGEDVLNVKRIVPTGDNDLWVEANGRMRHCDGRRWSAESEGWNREMGKLISLRFLHGDDEGGLWSSAGDLGLIHVLPDGTFHRLTTRDGLPSNTIHWAYQDHDGNTWTGYERGGLVQVRRRLFRAIGQDEKLNDSLINTVCEDVQGRVWIGTHSGTVGCYENGNYTNLTLTKIARAQDSCVAPDAQGRVWIGAQGVGLLLCETGQMSRIATPAQLQVQPQSQGYPRLLLQGRDGRLWVGTLWSIVSVTNGNTTVEYTAQTVGEHPTALAEAADGTIWAGTLAGSLLRWDGKQFVPVAPPDQNSLGRIWALWADPDGGLWAGTEQGGLLHWNNGRFRRYTTKDGLPSDSIEQVLGDAHGNLWLGTRAGIARIFSAAMNRFERGELEQLPVSVYGQSDGLLTIGSSIIFQPNCWRGHDGTLFFAMASGVAAVRPEQFRLNLRPPSVALEELRVDDKKVWPDHVGAVLTSSESNGEDDPSASPPAIKVGPGRGDLEFRFTGLSLGSPSRVRFKSKLEGLETGWSDAVMDKKASYRHVPPGKYIFHVVAWNSDGIDSKNGVFFAVIVQPYYYQTIWFRGGVALLVLLGLSVMVAMAMRQRMRRRMEQLRRQHELERERTRIAQDLHDDLGAGLTEIGLLGAMLQDPERFPERKPEALERIIQRCHSMVMALDEIVWAVNPHNDSVNSLGGYIGRYAQSFLELTSIRCRLEIEEAEPDHPLNSEQRHNLFLACEEALTNIAKYSKATEARVKISLDDKKLLLICIEDNGRGLPEIVGEDSNGLINLRQRMAQIGGGCDIVNRPAGGVSISLSLRLAS